METQHLILMMIGITIFNLIISLACAAVGVFAFIEVKSFMRSTHKVEFVPFDPETGAKGSKEVMNDDIFDEYNMME